MSTPTQRESSLKLESNQFNLKIIISFMALDAQKSMHTILAYK